jgi:hypothetical protein
MAETQAVEHRELLESGHHTRPHRGYDPGWPRLWSTQRARR